jgi:hypothetical protein
MFTPTPRSVLPAIIGLVVASACAVSEDISDEALDLAEREYGPVSSPATPVLSASASAPAPTQSGSVSATGVAPAAATSAPRPRGGGLFPTASASAAATAAAPARMTWDDCDPTKVVQVCPEAACSKSDLCSTPPGVFEADCVRWCQALIGCVSANESCITEEDPLCYSGSTPQDACADYVDANSSRSAGTNGARNFAGSAGSKAAIALLECACGG